VGGLIVGNFKVVIGSNTESGWAGEVYPNTSSHWDADACIEVCGNTPETGCLYDIFADPGEHVNVAAEHPDTFSKMVSRITEVNKTFFDPKRGLASPKACEVALAKYGGFWGPFVDVDSPTALV